MYYIGLDLGTSALKGLLVNENGEIEREATESYPVYYPKDGWCEQNPEDWLRAAKTVIGRLADGKERDVAALSIGGQMHGLVLIDDRGEVIRPAILWNDGRTAEETDYLNRTVGQKTLSALTSNIAFAGFTAPKILWIKAHEPENFSRIGKILLPKDYLAYRLTGVFSTDYSDASGTLLLDVRNKRWSKKMLEICSVKEEWLPRLYDSFEMTGKVKTEYLPAAYLAAGAGDNAAAAVGTGAVNDGDCSISLGTSGTIFIAGDHCPNTNNNALHCFAHATGKWHLMGCILSAAGANKWWVEDILRETDYEGALKDVTIGTNNVFFLPYLTGERSPHNDVFARGVFFGMRVNTTREEMSLAVIEGVSFALRDCLEAAKESGIYISRAVVCGGGAKSAIWKHVLANVLNCEIVSLKTEQGPSYGAAILAMVGSGLYRSVEDAAKQFVTQKEIIVPDPATADKYELQYKLFRRLYPSLKPLFADAALLQ